MNQSPTSWWRIWVAFLAGCVGAFQVGKVAAALSTIIDNLGLSLIEAGWIVSLFSVVGGLVAMGFGLLSDRIGHVRAALVGLSLSAIGAFWGAMADNLATLLIARMLEGLGFFMAVVALPSLISGTANDRDRPLAMGLWGAFMPAGIGVSLLISPGLIALHGWRGLWVDIGVILLVFCALLLLAFQGRSAHEGLHFSRQEIIASVIRTGPLLIFSGFVCYSSLYVAVTAFFPTMLNITSEVGSANAAYLGALVALGNIGGNLAAGALIGRGVAPARLLKISFIVMGVCATLVFLSPLSPLLKTFAGIVFSTIGGLYPGTAFVLASRYAIRPSHMALFAGLLLQGAAIGQVLGPLMTSALVEHGGRWDWAGIGTAGMACIGLLCAVMLSRSTARSAAQP